MLRFTQTDLFAVQADILVNTVNCVGVMGKGIALQFKKRYPKMFLDYRKACFRGDVKPGKLHFWHQDDKTIINFPTKTDWRYKSEYSYIVSGLISLRSFLLGRGKVRIAIPPLGCGNGGLDWGKVSKLIKEYLGDLEADIIVVKGAPIDQ